MMINQDRAHNHLLKATADAFRLGIEGQASENMIKLIDSLAPFVQNPACPNRGEINSLLTKMIEAQSRKDYLHTADLLEFELSRWLTGCKKEQP